MRKETKTTTITKQETKMPFNNNAIAPRIPRNIVNRPMMPVNPVQNMGAELLNPPAPLVRKLMELQAELLQCFPNQQNVVVAFNGHGGCLIGMEQQAMNNIIQAANPALNRHAPIGINAGNVRGYIG